MLEFIAKKTPKINKNVITIITSINAIELSNVRDTMLKTSVGNINNIDHLKAMLSIVFIEFLFIKRGARDCIKP